MRHAGIEKLGYYPTQPISLSHLVSLIQPAAPSIPVRIIDPCAGEGEAIAAIAKQLSDQGATVEIIAIELSSERAPKLPEMLLSYDKDKPNKQPQNFHEGITIQHLQADYLGLTSTREACSLAFLNPPYDWDAEKGESGSSIRLEQRFLTSTTDRLQPGGLLIYVVPEKALSVRRISQHLTTLYENLTIHRMPPDEYKDFGQVIITANKRELPNANPDLRNELITIGHNKMRGAILPAEITLHDINDPDTTKGLHRALIVPRQAKKSFQMRRQLISHAEVITALKTKSAHSTSNWRDLTPITTDTDFQPPIPLKIGHIGSLISSGQMGTVELDDVIAKGMAAKRTRAYDEEGNIVQPDDDKASTVREYYEITIQTIDQLGQIQTINNTEQVTIFLHKYANPIAQILAKRFQPLYEAPTDAEWAALEPLIPHKMLPMATKPGLLTAQKHVAAAAARCAVHYGWADVIGEMGVGKSSVSLAALHLMDSDAYPHIQAYPAAVVAPSHLLEKWARETTDVNPEATPIIVNDLPTLIRVTRDYQEGDKTIFIFSKEKLKLGPGWAPIYHTKRHKEFYTHKDPETNHTETRSRWTTLVVCPKCGQVQVNTDGVPLSEEDFNRGKAKACRAPVSIFIGDENGDNSKGTMNHKDAHGKPRRCNAPLYSYAHWEARENLTGRPSAHKGFCETNQMTEYKLKTYRRWPLSRYIKKHLRNFFQVTIVDEFHQYKGKSTDQATSYHHMIDSSKYVLNLTGTLFGGKSTDLMWLRYRIDREVRAEYDFHDEMRWAKNFGRLEYSITTGESEARSDGKFSKATRYTNRAKEIPGISPAIFSTLLKTCIFIRIKDLGYALPDYDEEIQRIFMSVRQEAQYKWMDELLLATIQEGMKSFDAIQMETARKLLGVYLQNALARPNSAFRNEVILWKPQDPDRPDKNRYPFLLNSAVHPLPDFGYDTQDDMDQAEPTEKEAQGIADAIGQAIANHDPAERFAHLEIPGYEHENTITAIINQAQIKLQEAPLDSAEYDEWFERQMQENYGEWLTQLQEINPNLNPMVLRRIPDNQTLLPKEQWLIDYCRKEKAANRKVILFVRQSGSRDIQPRLQRILESASFQATILPNGVSPAKREAWIAKRTGMTDILITNPKKVETGLDLIDYATCIFYEVEFSLYTLWQAMRRLWRLGQRKPVKVVFSVYRHALEEQALNLVGQKMQAALLVYGDDAASAITNEADGGGDFLSELANKVLKKEEIASDGITGILKQNAIGTDEQNQETQWDGIEVPAIEVPAITDESNDIEVIDDVEYQWEEEQQEEETPEEQPVQDQLHPEFSPPLQPSRKGLAIYMKYNKEPYKLYAKTAQLISTSQDHVIIAHKEHGHTWSVPIETDPKRPNDPFRNYGKAKPHIYSTGLVDNVVGSGQMTIKIDGQRRLCQATIYRSISSGAWMIPYHPITRERMYEDAIPYIAPDNGQQTPAHWQTPVTYDFMPPEPELQVEKPEEAKPAGPKVIIHKTSNKAEAAQLNQERTAQLDTNDHEGIDDNTQPIPNHPDLAEYIDKPSAKHFLLKYFPEPYILSKATTHLIGTSEEPIDGHGIVDDTGMIKHNQHGHIWQIRVDDRGNRYFDEAIPRFDLTLYEIIGTGMMDIGGKTYQTHILQSKDTNGPIWHVPYTKTKAGKPDYITANARPFVPPPVDENGHSHVYWSTSEIYNGYTQFDPTQIQQPEPEPAPEPEPTPTAEEIITTEITLEPKLDDPNATLSLTDSWSNWLTKAHDKNGNQHLPKAATTRKPKAKPQPKEQMTLFA